MRRKHISAKLGTASNCPSDSIQLGLLQARSLYPPGSDKDQSERTGIALAAARCRPLRSSAHRRRFRFTSMDATYR